MVDNGKNGKKENQSFSCPGYVLEALDQHLADLNKSRFEKIDKSQWICKAIRTQMILDKAESPEFWKKLYDEEE